MVPGSPLPAQQIQPTGLGSEQVAVVEELLRTEKKGEEELATVAKPQPAVVVVSASKRAT